MLQTPPLTRQNKNAVKWACAWNSSELGPLQINQRLANILSTALQQNWADPAADSQTGPPPTHQHLSDTTERLFGDCCRALLPSLLILDRFGPLGYEAQTLMNYIHSTTKWRSHRNASSRVPEKFWLHFFAKFLLCWKQPWRLWFPLHWLC